MSESATEVGELLVRLTGDGSSFHKMTEDVQHGAEEASKHVEHAAQKIDKFTHSVRLFAHHATEAMEATKIGEWIREAFHEFGEAEHQSHRLEAALETQGREVEGMTEQYNHFADAMQDVTTVSRDATIAMLAQAETMGLTGEAAKRAAKIAISLSAAKTGSVDNAGGMMRAAIMMEQGNNALVKRMLGLRGVKNESEAAAKIQKTLAAGFKIAEGQAHGALGQFEQLHNMYKQFLVSIGKVVAEGVHPFVEGLKAVVKWFQALSPGVKEFIAYFAELTAVFLMIGPAMAVFGILAGLFNPIILVLAAVTAGAIYLIHTFGGIESIWHEIAHYAVEAWDIVLEKSHEVAEYLEPYAEMIGGWFTKGWEVVSSSAVKAFDSVIAAASSFFDWFRPVTFAATSFFSTAWTAAVDVVIFTWDRMKESAAALWETIQLGWDITVQFFKDGISASGIEFQVFFDAVRDGIRDAFYAGEFAIKNFQEVVSLAWTMAMLGFVQFGNELEYFFTVQAPAWFDWFLDNWTNLFETIYNFAKTVFANLAENAGNFFSKLWESMTGGDVDWNEGWKGLADGFKNTLQQLPDIAKRQMSDLEVQLNEDVERMGGEISKNFAKFKEAKGGDYGASFDIGEDIPKELPKHIKEATTEAENEADKLGMKTGTKLKEGKKKGEKNSFDAADFFSSEALSRLTAFADKGGVSGNDSSGGKGAASEFGSSAAQGGIDESIFEEMEAGIGELVQIGRQQLSKDPIEIGSAELA